MIFIAHAKINGSDPCLTSVTYGGQPMTKVIERNYNSFGGNRVYVAAYILNEAGVAAATNNTFVTTWRTPAPTTIGYSSAFFSDVLQAALVGATASNNSTTNPVTTSALATSDGNMVVLGATCGSSGSYTLNNGFTEGTDQTMNSTATGVTGYKAATGVSETPSATFSGTPVQVIVGLVIQAASNPNQVSNPNPANGAKNVVVTTSLSWTAGAGATSFDVYFGTDPCAHNNPKITVDTNSYDPPGDLLTRTMYYWAVDSNANGTITGGNDWNFKTYVPQADLRVADYIVSVPLTDYYATICSFYGVLMYSQVVGDTGLKNSVITAYEPYLTGEKVPPEGDVDKNIFGILPFELYRQTGDANYLTLARYLADKEFATPRSDGLSSYTRFWIDDTYMIGSLQANAYKATAEPNYANHATVQLLGYMGAVNQMQQPNGLFYHTLNAPIHWGRGNGWAAASMTEVLLSIPQNHPDRALLLTKYQNMMTGLIACQDANGMWYQVLDRGSDPCDWVESSCTGMFVFAMATGVRQGWLPEEPYKQATWKGWLALKNYVNSQGQVMEVCTGTSQSSDPNYYFNRPREVGNTHGQAAFIWAAAAMEQLRLKGDINADGKVDFNDLKILTDNWLDNEPPSADIAPIPGDGIINFLDFAKFAEDWGD